MSVSTAKDVSRALLRLGEAIRDDVRRLVEQAAGDVAAEIAEGYRTKVGRVSGILQDRGVRVVEARDSDGLARIVIPLAPHTHLVEFGTRHRQTKRNASRGAMPATRIVVPAAKRHRSIFHREVERVVERACARVDR